MNGISKTVAIFGETLRVTVTMERVRKGCDCCKRDPATERFIGLCGNVLWICRDCFDNVLCRWPEKRVDA